MATSTVTITGTDVSVTVDGTRVFPAGSAPVPPQPQPGSGTIKWGTNGHPAQGGSPYASMPLAQQLALVKEMGLKDYRIDLYQADQTARDLLHNLIVEGDKQGISILPVIIPGFQSYPTEKAAYDAGKAFAQQMAVWFPAVQVWELGNEYELASQIKGQGSHISDYDPVKYQKARGCYKGMLDGMRAGNASAKGCIDTSGHGHFGWTDELWKDGVRWDITGEHFYSEGGNVDIRCLYLECGETDKLQLLKDHYGLPIWMTEFAYWYAEDEAHDKASMAEYLTTTMAQYDSFAGDYNLVRVHIYELLDEPQCPGREGQFGLCSDRGVLNPAGDAVRSYLVSHPSAASASSTRGRSRR